MSQNLSYSDNQSFSESSDSSFYAQTNLGFSLSSVTRTETLALNANTGLVLGSNGNEVLNPSVTLSYGQQAKSASISADLSYRSVDLDSYVATEEDLFVLTDATLSQYSGNIGYQFGLDAPFGGSINLSHAARSYANTSDPDLLDSTTTSLSSNLRFQFDPRITGTASASITKFDEDGGIDRTTTSVGVGADLAVNKNLTTGVNLSYNLVETTDGANTETVDGIGLSANFTQDMPDGSISGSVSTGIGQNGRQYNVSLGRNLELKNGSLGFSLGGTQTDDSGFNPIYGLSYNTELVKGGNLSARLNQSFRTATDGTESINSTLSVNYSQELTRVSSLNAGFSFRDNNVTNVAGEDSSRMDLNLGYRHSLTRDWGLVGGYTHSFASVDGEGDRNANTVYLGVDRTFDWRP